MMSVDQNAICIASVQSASRGDPAKPPTTIMIFLLLTPSVRAIGKLIDISRPSQIGGPP
jgi:hypothetical protein